MQPSLSQVQPNPVPSPARVWYGRRGLWRGVGLLALLLLLGLGWWAWAITRNAQAFLADVQMLEGLVREPQALLVDGATHLATAQADLEALRQSLGPLPQVAQGFAWVPGYGHDLAAVAPLLDASDQSLAAAAALLQALEPLMAHADNPAQLDAAMLLDRAAELRSARPAMAAALQQAQAAEAAWAAVPLDDLAPPWQARARRAHELTLLTKALAAFAVASSDLEQVVAPLQPYATALSAGVQEADLLLPLLLDDPAGLLAALEQSTAHLETARTSAHDAEQAWAQVPPARLRGQLAPMAQLPALYLASFTTLEATTASAQALVPILLDQRAGQPLGPLVKRRLSAQQAPILAAQAQLVQAELAWAALDPAGLPEPLAPYLAHLPAGLRSGAEALELLAMLPALLGADGQRDYLLLAQSGDELRATGGFITSAGILSLLDGHVLDLDLEDSGPILPPPGVALPYAPEPLGRYMRIYRWVFRDANWSPDFPTSARVASQLYALSDRPLVPDVVALDFGAFKQILETIGPVTVAGEAEPVSAATVRAYIERQHDLFGSNNEVSVGPLTRAILERIATGDLELAPLIATMRRLATERHLLIAASDPAEAALFARLGWDGAVRPQGSDFLMVVDDNLGYTKSNYSLQQELHYAIDLRNLNAPVATLSITYTHTAPAEELCPARGERRGMPYAEMKVMCYRGYLRVLAPPAATLLHAEHGPTPGSLTWTGLPDAGEVVSGLGHANLREFATYFALNQGEVRSLSLRYSLPATVVTSSEDGYHYHLHVQKQAGREELPLWLALHLPPGMRLLNPPASLKPNGTGGYHGAFSLNRDLMLDVTFR
ncbi:DUF4012 domain-containing protein [Candidatus Viridilinea mediisalina]|nr:DUF4012 domain-containing protein [Candidatus Viridilinea mediisalina]